MSHDCPRRACLALALLLVAVGASPAPGQPADGTPRSVYAPDDPFLFPFPRVHCYRAFCKYYPSDGAFPDTPIWTHTTNIARPPRPVWMIICGRNTAGQSVYRHVVIQPGRTHWVIVRIPRGHWGWINNWIYDPGVFFQPLQLAQNSSVRGDDGIRSNESACTVQVDRAPAAVLGERVDLQPGDTPPWSIDAEISTGPGTMTTAETWSSPDDPLIDQSIVTTVNDLPNGATQLVEMDEDNDGLVDVRVEITFLQVAPSTMTLDLLATRGETASGFSVVKTSAGGTETTVTETDSDGDGDADCIETETAETTGTTTKILTERDLDADGTIDETETTVLDYDGELSGTQTTEVRDARGALTERIEVTISPTLFGYAIVARHDEDGDGVFDVRETHFSNPLPFGQGDEFDLFRIDEGDDGTIDSETGYLTSKSTTPGSYTETVDLDADSDGEIDASVSRKVFLACAGDADGDSLVGFGDLILVLSTWGPCPGCPADLDGDGIVGFLDLLSVLSNWGPC